MRSDALLFVHVLAAFALVGGTIAVAALALAARTGGRPRLLERIAFRASALVAAAWVVTIALGESLRSKEDAEGTWLDVSYGLAYAGLLVGGVLVTFLLRASARADAPRPRALAWAALLAPLVLSAELATVFLMTGKPGA